MKFKNKQLIKVFKIFKIFSMISVKIQQHTLAYKLYRLMDKYWGEGIDI